MAARQHSETPVPLSLVCPFLVTGGLAESDEPFEENLDVRDRRDQEFCAAGFDQISRYEFSGGMEKDLERSSQVPDETLSPSQCLSCNVV